MLSLMLLFREHQRLIWGALWWKLSLGGLWGGGVQKLCLVVVSFVRWGRIQNFRPLGPLFLVEVEFLVGWGGVGDGVNSNNHVKPNSVELSWGCVEVELGLWQLSFKCLNPTRRIFHICKPEVWCWKKGCDWHYLTCDNSIHWPLTSEGGWAGGSACGQVGGWVSLLDRVEERLGGRVVVGGGWWVKLGGWLKVMVGG